MLAAFMGHMEATVTSQTDGRPIRWNFSNITEESFEWDGWVSDDEGRTWWLEQHIDAKRTG